MKREQYDRRGGFVPIEGSLRDRRDQLAPGGIREPEWPYGDAIKVHAIVPDFGRANSAHGCTLRHAEDRVHREEQRFGVGWVRSLESYMTTVLRL